MDGIKQKIAENPTLAKSLIAGLVGGAVTGGTTAFSDRRSDETSGDKRKRVLRNALLGAGLAGGATAAVSYGADQLGTALPVNASDPVSDTVKGVRNFAADHTAWLPTQLLGGHLAQKRYDRSAPQELPDRISKDGIRTPVTGTISPQDRAMVRAGELMNHSKATVPPANLKEFIARGLYADKTVSPDMADMVVPGSAHYEAANKEFAHHVNNPSAQLMQAIRDQKEGKSPLDSAGIRNLLNRSVAEGSIFDKGDAHGSFPDSPSELHNQSIGLQQMVRDNLGSGLSKSDLANTSTTSRVEEILRRSGVNYSKSGLKNKLNAIRGWGENNGIAFKDNGMPQTKQMAIPGTNPRMRGAAGLAGGLLAPGILANLMRGEFRASDYIPHIPFVN